jgi:transposase
LTKRSQKHQLTEQTLLVTADIGKFKNWVYFRFPDGTEMPPFEVANTGQGFKKLWSKINTALCAHGLTDVVFGFESTGAYAEPLLHFLRARKVKLVQVNPAHSKRVKELQDNSPNKTDKKDPRVIADIIELGRALSVVIPEGVAAELRRLTHARERSVERRTALYNQLQDLVFVLFPEFLQVMKDVTTKSARYLIEHHGTPALLLALSLTELTQLIRHISRGKLGPARAEALYQVAQESGGIAEGQHGLRLEIQELLRLIGGSDEFIIQLEAQMLEHLAQIPYSRYLLSIPGLGATTVAGLIDEVADFGNFKSLEELLKYAGLNLYEISSGQHKGQRRISKRGRPLIRKLLYFAALRVVHKGGIFHRQYQNHLAHGMIKNKALVAICRKLLAIMFAVARDQRDYVADYQVTVPTLKQAA